MFRRFALLTLVAGCTLSAAASADPVSAPLGDSWKLTLDGHFRPRILIDTGKDFQGGRANEWVTQRARLGVTLEEHTGLSFTLRLQDVRVWGEEADTLNDFHADGFDAHEAFVVVPVFDDELSLKVGRQEIIFDNSRLVGNVGWTQRARSFDAARMTWSFAPAQVDVFYAKIKESESNLDGNVPDIVEDDFDFAGLHSAIEVSKGHTLAPMYLLNANHGAFTNGGDHVRHTLGVNATGKVDGFAYTGEFYYQFGELEDPARGDRTVKTFMAAAGLGYTADVALKPGISGWFEFLNGDGTPEGTFDTLYATNHKFYGEMDFFLNIPVHTASLGLMDVGGRLSAAFTKQLKANLDFHHFRAVEASPQGDKSFGNELDVKLVWSPMQHLSFATLYGIFLPGEAMRAPKKIPVGPDLEPEHLLYIDMDVVF